MRIQRAIIALMACMLSVQPFDSEGVAQAATRESALKKKAVRPVKMAKKKRKKIIDPVIRNIALRDPLPCSGDPGATPIRTPEELRDLINQNPAGRFRLCNDLDLSGQSFFNIGSYFTGSLDGQNFAIRNFSPDVSGASPGSFGLFGALSGATIKNLRLLDAAPTLVSASGAVGLLSGISVPNGRTPTRLENVEVRGAIAVSPAFSAADRVGLVVGDMALTEIAGLRVEGSITGAAQHIGGVSGLYTWGSVSGPVLSVHNVSLNVSISASNVYAGDYIGGVFGWAPIRFTLRDIRGSVTINGAATRCGGLVGKTDGQLVENIDLYDSRVDCLNDPEFTSYGQYTGGLIGTNNNHYDHSIIRNARFHGTVRGVLAGGLIGIAYNSGNGMQKTVSIERSRALLTLLEASDVAGGLVAYNNTSAITLRDAFARGEVVQQPLPSGSTITLSAAGGLVGAVTGLGTVDLSHTYYSGQIASQSSSRGAILGGAFFAEVDPSRVVIENSIYNVSLMPSSNQYGTGVEEVQMTTDPAAYPGFDFEQTWLLPGSMASPRFAELRFPLCAADRDASGSVSLLDLFEYLESYFSQSNSADMNSDGNATIQDLLDFLVLFFRGCGV